MKVECPCRLRERFSYDGVVMCKRGRFVLTGLDFFAWSTPGMSGVTLCAKRDPEQKDENTRFYDPKDPAEGIRIAFDIPDAMIRPGFPLRELGIYGGPRRSPAKRVRWGEDEQRSERTFGKARSEGYGACEDEDTDAVGHLQGLGLTEDGWEYHIYFGKDYGGPREAVRTEKLDELFKPVLPLHAVSIDLKNYLL